MEKEGLVRSVSFLKKKNFKVGILVTDRHKQIAKWVRENLPATTNYYDVWHVAKCKFTLFYYHAFQTLPFQQYTHNSTEEKT